MTHELLLTSVAQGPDPKDRGLCPAAADAAIPPRIVQHLFPLSRYRHLEGEPNASPVAYSHLILPGGMEHVLSRVADAGLGSHAGLGNQQKPNVLAHHIVLEGLNVVAESPAWLLALPGFHFSEWNGPLLRFTHGRPIPTLTNPQPLTRRQQIARQHCWLDPKKMALTGSVDTQSETYLAAVRNNEAQAALTASPTTPCPVWQELTGDAGWGGVLAETALTKQPVVLIYHPGQNILPLFVEALAMLPPYMAWRTTFSTYFTGLPDGFPCQWKGVVSGSEEVKMLVGDLSNLVLDLTVPRGTAPPGHYVDYARNGQEQQLPLDAEEYTAALADADAKSHADKQKAGKIDVLPTKMPDSALPAIHLPKRQSGLLETFLRRSSRSQFYVLYGIMSALMLFLLVLAVDQVGNFGIFQKRPTGNQPENLVQPDAGEPEPPLILSELDEPEPEGGEQDFLTDADRILTAFEEDKKKQREGLLSSWEDFTLPAFLAVKFPDVVGEQIFPPAQVMFEGLENLQPFAAALELRFVPLLKLPDVEIETTFVSDALPDLVWRVEAVDTWTRLPTLMFLFQWTESGLEMGWQPEGLMGAYLYETLLSSLGFLQFRVAGEPEFAMEIPLFAPQVAEPVRVAELVSRRETETPEYVVALPFAPELWQPIFAYMKEKGLRINAELEIRAEPAGDWVQIEVERPNHLAGTPLETHQVLLEVRTSQRANVPKEGGEFEYEEIAIPFTATASLDSVVWTEDTLTERLGEEWEKVQSEKVNWEERVEQLRTQAFDGDAVARTERTRYDALLQQGELDRRRIESLLEKLPAAYAEIGEDESQRFHYSVWLVSSEGERKLLVLTTDF